MNKFDYKAIPPYTLDAMRRWVLEAQWPGGFLSAVMQNDLTRAVGAADSENIKVIPQIAMFLYNKCPAVCWGDKDTMLAYPGELESLRGSGYTDDSLWRPGF